MHLSLTLYASVSHTASGSQSLTLYASVSQVETKTESSVHVETVDMSVYVTKNEMATQMAGKHPTDRN